MKRTKNDTPGLFTLVDKPLRFCMVTTFYPPYSFGGDGIFVRNLAHELARRGHQVHVIHCIDTYCFLAGREPSGCYLKHPNVTVHGLRSPFGFVSPLATQQTGQPWFKLKQIKAILAQGFDVINYHNISTVGGPGILQYGDAIKLYTLHEYWLSCQTHVLFKFQRKVCERKHCFLCSLSYKRPPQWWRYTRLLEKAVKHIDMFIAPDRFTPGRYRKLGLDLPSRRIPHFMPESRVTGSAATTLAPSHPLQTQMQERYFLFVGRLEKLKGLQTLIPIFQRYRGARLLVAGTGGYEKALKRMAASAQNIVFLGYQNKEWLDILYSNAIALIVPSVNYEVSPPLTILEAFQHKTPVIVRNLGSMPEPVEDSGGGFVYTSDDELVVALDLLLEEPLASRRLGERGYRALLKERTADAYMANYFGLIREIAQSRGLAKLDRFSGDYRQ